MNKKLILGLAASGALLAVVAMTSWQFQRDLGASLPPRYEAVNIGAARFAAAVRAAVVGGTVVEVLGTGSMQPYLSVARPGEDPLQTVVACVVTDPKVAYGDLKKGQLVLYRGDWTEPPGGLVMHVLAQQDGEGWILSGLGNRYSESRWRVTARNFVAVVDSAYVWPR